jgi:hypothetical protein
MKKLAKLESSTQYSQFAFYETNRPIDTGLKKYKELKESLFRDGWVPSFPATCHKVGSKLMIVDGQNRFTAAKELGIPVIYVIITQKINVAQINSVHRPWSGNDYASSFAAEGNVHYKRLVAFRNKHGLSANRAASLLLCKQSLMGDTGSGTKLVRDGNLTINDDAIKFAEIVISVAESLPKKFRNHRGTVAAIARVLAIDDVDPDVMRSKLSINEDMIVPRVSIEDGIAMLESIYNKRNRYPVAISLLATKMARAKTNNSRQSK